MKQKCHHLQAQCESWWTRWTSGRLMMCNLDGDKPEEYKMSCFMFSSSSQRRSSPHRSLDRKTEISYGAHIELWPWPHDQIRCEWRRSAPASSTRSPSQTHAHCNELRMQYPQVCAFLKTWFLITRYPISVHKSIEKPPRSWPMTQIQTNMRGNSAKFF